MGVGETGKCCYGVSVYRALVDSDDLQQLVLRQYEECDCGSGGDGQMLLKGECIQGISGL